MVDGCTSEIQRPVHFCEGLFRRLSYISNSRADEYKIGTGANAFCTQEYSSMGTESSQHKENIVMSRKHFALLN